MISKRRCALPVILSLAVVAVALVFFAPSAAAQDVINEDAYWRMYATWQTPSVVTADGAVKPLYNPTNKKAVPVIGLTAPPPDWFKLEFDDTSWSRTKGPFWLSDGYGARIGALGERAELRAVYIRGRFHVRDPKRVTMMKLLVRYRGGAVAYVNGKELQRGHLPKGELGPETLAEAYSPDCYLRPSGKLLHELSDPKVKDLKHGHWIERFRKRVRSLPRKGWLHEVAIPSSMLRKGTNVVAIACYSAPVSELRLTTKFAKLTYRGEPAPWAHAGIIQARVTCAPGPGLVPSIKRPEGFQLWNRRIYQRVFMIDFGPRCEPLRPIRMIGVRNGTFSGQVVLGTTELIEGLKADVTDLKGPGGAVISKSEIAVRFVRPDGPAFRGAGRAFDGLVHQPPKELEPPTNKAVVQPIWVSVKVPRDAKAGEYKGKLTVQADQIKAREVPVHLKVIDWTLPDSTKFTTHIELVQSPETLAHRYKTPLWSKKHWELMDRSFKLIAQVGNKVLHIPVIRRTYFGNKHSMVKWIGKAGSYTHDFSLVEQYLDAAVKRLGKIPVVVMYCRDHNTGAYYFGKTERSKPKGMPFTLLDPKTGKLEEAIGPLWGTEECKKFWKPVMDGLYEILKARGIEKSFMVGISGDQMPSKACVDDLKAVAPYAGWVSASHANRRSIYGQPTGYVTDVWSSAGLLMPDFRRRRNRLGWNDPRIRVPFPRAGGSRFVGPTLRTYTDFGTYRRAPEGGILSGVRGFGRCGADFWPVFQTDWRFRGFLARYPETAGWHGGSLVNSFPYILAQGRDGPIPTVRLEMLREGLQETEARICIERVLTDPAKRAKVGKSLAERCWKLLDDRAYIALRSRSGANLVRSYYIAGLEERSDRLYSAAAAVARALAGK